MEYEKLEKFVTQIRGISYKPSEVSEIPHDDYVPILKANNIQENGLDESKLIYINKNRIKEEQYIKRGDLLLATSSGSKDIVGKNIYFDEDFNGSFGAFCKIVRPNEGIRSNFLAVFFKSISYKRHIRKLIQGANINNLRNEHIDTLPVPKFSDLDQIRIANILNTAKTLIEQRRSSIELLNKYLTSTFWKTFGDLLTIDKGWNKITLGEHLNVKHGYAFKSEFFKSSGDFILLTPGNFYEAGGYRDRGEKQKYFVGDIPSDYILAKDSLLIAMTEQAAGLLGSAVIIPEDNRFLHNQRLGLVQFNSDIFNTNFLFHLFNSKRIRRIIHSKATGTKVRHTSPTKIESIEIYS